MRRWKEALDYFEQALVIPQRDAPDSLETATLSQNLNLCRGKYICWLTPINWFVTYLGGSTMS